MKKRILAITLALCMSVALFAACGGGDDPTPAPETPGPADPAPADPGPADPAPADPGTADDPVVSKEPVEISITYATGDEVLNNLLHARVEGFMNENEHVTIVEKLSSGEGSYLDALKVLESVGELPDIIEMRDTAYFVRGGKLGELPAEIIERIDAPVAVYDKYYTSPLYEGFPIGVIYSKQIFNDLGIDPSNINTYGDFMAVCETINNAGIAPIVVGGADIWHMGFWWSYFWLNNVSNVEPDWLAKRYAGEVSFASDPKIRAAIQGLDDLFKSGYIEPGWTSTAESMCPAILVSGQAAMYYIGTWTFAQLEETDPGYEFGFFGLPSSNGELNIMGGPTAAGWAINKETQETDPNKTQAVYDFIEYFYREDNYRDFLQGMGQLSSTATPISYDMSEQLQSAMDLVNGSTTKRQNWNSLAGTNELPPGFRNFCYKLVSELFLDMHTLDSVLEQMDQEWNTASADFNPVLNPDALQG